MQSPRNPAPNPPDLSRGTKGTARSLELLASLLNDFPDAAVVTDTKRAVVFLNCAARKLFGDALRPGDPCPLCSATPLIVRAGNDAPGAPSCPRPGDPRKGVPVILKTRWPLGPPLSLSATAIQDPDGSPAGCCLLLREHAELLVHPMMEQQTATLSSILENFPMPFFLVDPELVITHLNDHMEKLTGYAKSEVVGRKTCGEVLNTVQCNTCDCVLKQVMEHQKPISGLRLVVRNREGREIPVAVSASIITDPEGNVIGGFEALRDITAIVEA